MESMDAIQGAFGPKIDAAEGGNKCYPPLFADEKPGSGTGLGRIGSRGEGEAPSGQPVGCQRYDLNLSRKLPMD